MSRSQLNIYRGMCIITCQHNLSCVECVHMSGWCTWGEEQRHIEAACDVEYCLLLTPRRTTRSGDTSWSSWSWTSSWHHLLADTARSGAQKRSIIANSDFSESQEIENSDSESAIERPPYRTTNEGIASLHVIVCLGTGIATSLICSTVSSEAWNDFTEGLGGLTRM